MRDDESHGLLTCNAGRGDERHVEVIAHAQAREVVRHDALVQCVVDRAATNLAREKRCDVLPAVLANECQTVVLGVVERHLRVIARGRVDHLVQDSTNRQELCL